MRKQAIHVKSYNRSRHGRASYGGRVCSHDKSGARSGRAEFMVFNDTDGVYASGDVFRSRKDAQDFIQSFRNAFKQQGYYFTSSRERIPASQVKLRIEELAWQSNDEYTDAEGFATIERQVKRSGGRSLLLSPVPEKGSTMSEFRRREALAEIERGPKTVFHRWAEEAKEPEHVWDKERKQWVKLEHAWDRKRKEWVKKGVRP